VRGQHPLLRVFEDDALRGRDAQSRRDVQEEIRMRLDAGDTLVGRDRLEVSREVESAQDRLDVLPVRRRRQGESPVSMECLDEGERAGHGTERGLHQRHEDAELRPPEDVRIVVEPAPAYEVIDPEAGADPMVGEFLFRDLDADTSERLAPRLAVKAFGVGQEPVEVEVTVEIIGRCHCCEIAEAAPARMPPRARWPGIGWRWRLRRLAAVRRGSYAATC
jgi:hypothetical protein